MLINDLNLRLFDGGASASGDGAAESAPASSQSKAGEFENVVFGKPKNSAEPAKAEQVDQEQRDFDAEFKKLIKGEYKDAYKQATQKLIDTRFAKAKETESKLIKAEKVLNIFARKYGETNVDKLIDRIENDESLFEREAMEAGMSPEQYMEIQKIKAYADSQRDARIRLEQQMNVDNQLVQWRDEANALKEIYPEFDLETECENKSFVKLLESGVDMQHAYKVIHYNEFMEQNVASAMSQSAKATAQNIAARGTRPKENGANKNPGLIYKTDVSKFTPKEREEIARRVAMGETISF